MQIILPAQIDPPRIRKDGSAKISFDTRELSAEEIFTIVSLRNIEGWVVFAPNKEQVAVPDENAHLDTKSPSERLRNVLFVWYKQETESGNFVGPFETFRLEKMEKIIEGVKSKLEN